MTLSMQTNGIVNAKRPDPASDTNDIEAFAREIDDLLEKYKAKIGQEDLDFIEHAFTLSRRAEISGRLLLHFSIDPFTWLLGSMLLAYHMGSNDSLMHIVYHGAYDNIPNVPDEFHSDKTRISSFITRSMWKSFHVRHHAHTNQPARDTDWGFGVLRWSSETPWRPFHVLQVPGTILATIFPFGGLSFWYPFYQSGITEFVLPESLLPAARFWETHDWPTFKKSFSMLAESLLRYHGTNFVLYPALAGVFWPKVALGNLLAHYVSGAMSWLHTTTPHIGRPPYDQKPKNKAEWYVQQIEGTSDLKVDSELMRIFCGGNQMQIEHHLYSKFPVSRLWEMAPEVEALCKKYGIQHTTDTWGQRARKTLTTLFKHSFPSA